MDKRREPVLVHQFRNADLPDLQTIKEEDRSKSSSSVTLAPPASNAGDFCQVDDLIDLDSFGEAPATSGRPPPGYKPSGTGYISDHEPSTSTAVDHSSSCQQNSPCAANCSTMSNDSAVLSDSATHTLQVTRRPHHRSLTPSGTARKDSFNSDIEAYGLSGDSEVYGEITDISGTVNDIRAQLSALAENAIDGKHVRLKQDNAVLNARLQMLEDQLQTTEQRWKQRFEEEKKRHVDLSARVEREKYLESETLSLKLQLVQREHGECERQKEKHESEVQRLKAENTRLAEKIEDIEFQLDSLSKDHSNATDRLRSSYKKMEKELEGKDEIIIDMQEQLEALKPLAQSVARRGSTWERREDELEEELQKLREEHKELKERNEDLKEQLLMAAWNDNPAMQGSGNSLADEMGESSKEKVLQALETQEVTNQRLRAYIDGILLRIVEIYPAILEVQLQTDEEKISLKQSARK